MRPSQGERELRVRLLWVVSFLCNITKGEIASFKFVEEIEFKIGIKVTISW